MRMCYIKTDKDGNIIASQLIPYVDKDENSLYFEYFGFLEDLIELEDKKITPSVLEKLNYEKDTNEVLETI